VRIHVLFFAHLRDATGLGHADVELPAGATLVDLREALSARWPALAGYLGRFPAVVNGTVVRGAPALADGDEVAWLPPVAGGAGEPLAAGAVVEARLTRDPLDPQGLARAVTAPWAGAVVVFTGVVRDHEGERRVERLEYEAYERLAGERLRAVAEEALARWPRTRIAVAHRVGILAVGEASAVVAVAAAHRAEAFDCCRHVLEEIKKRLPVWKKSHGPDGAVWVEGEPYDEGR
jgi:molybdopterin synthase catalytic subunit/molybdopterin converting factor small subunit